MKKEFEEGNIFVSCLRAFTQYIFYLALIFIIGAIFIPVNVSASSPPSITVNSTLTIIGITDNSMTISIVYNSLNRPLGATFGGVEIIGFNKQFNSTYTGKELEPNTSHTFCVYGDATINCISDYTSIEETTSLDSIFNFILVWLIVIAALGCLVIGFYEPIVAYGAFIFSCMGIVQNINENFYLMLVYVIVLVASIFVAFKEK